MRTCDIGMLQGSQKGEPYGKYGDMQPHVVATSASDCMVDLVAESLGDIWTSQGGLEVR